MREQTIEEKILTCFLLEVEEERLLNIIKKFSTELNVHYDNNTFLNHTMDLNYKKVLTYLITKGIDVNLPSYKHAYFDEEKQDYIGVLPIQESLNYYIATKGKNNLILDLLNYTNHDEEYHFYILTQIAELRNNNDVHLVLNKTDLKKLKRSLPLHESDVSKETLLYLEQQINLKELNDNLNNNLVINKMIKAKTKI